jgi:hypothetical protein
MPVVFTAEQDGIACLYGRKSRQGPTALPRQPQPALSRPCSGKRRSAWAPVLLGVLALVACGTAEPESPPAQACPAALLLNGAERTSAYRAGAEGRADALRYVAILTDLSSSCRYYGDATGQGVDVDLSFKLIAERGPALSATEEVTYFVATVGPGNQIFSRDVLSGDLPFTGDAERVGLSEDLTLRLPSITADQGGAYTLYVGFQLDDAQLEREQQPALR